MVDESKVVDVTAPVDTTVTLNAKTATVDAGKSVIIGDVEYTAASGEGERSFSLENGNLTVVGDKAVIPGGKTASISSGEGAVSISVSGEGDGANTSQISVTKTGSGAVVEVASEGGKFTVGEKTYEAPWGGAKYTVDSSGNAVLEVDFSKAGDSKGYELSPGETVLVGGYLYTYTAPSGESEKGKAVITARAGGLNPSVNLTNEGGTVKVALKDNPSTCTDYTAASANTTFAMSLDDNNTKKIDLLSNSTTESKIVLPEGSTATAGSDSITAGQNGATVQLRKEGSEEKLVLVSGEGSSKGSMSTAIGGIYLSFVSESIGYTIGVSENAQTLTLNSNGSVKMNDNVTFSGSKDQVFNIGKPGEVLTSMIPGGATIVGTNVSIRGAENSSASVEIDPATGNLTLAGGKGQVTGNAIFNVKYTGGSETTETVEVKVPAGTTVDAETKTVSGVGAGETVEIGGVTYTSVEDSSFPLSGGTLAKGGEKAKVPSGITADVSIALNSGDVTVTVPKENKGDTTVEKGSPSTVTLNCVGDKFTVGGKAYEAASAHVIFKVDNEGTVSISSGSTALGDGESIKGGSGIVICNPDSTKGDDVTIQTAGGEDTITVPAAGQVKIGERTYTNQSGAEKTVIEATKDGISLAGGSVGLGKDESIRVGQFSVSNISGSDQMFIVEVGADKTRTVTIPLAGGKLKVGDEPYTAPLDSTRVRITDDGKIEVEGAKLEKNQEINIGEQKLRNDGEGEVTVELVDNSSYGITIPSGGSISIGGMTIGPTTKETSVRITKNGVLNVDAPVKVNGVTYEGNGAELTIDLSGNNVVRITGEAVIVDGSPGTLILEGEGDSIQVDGNTYVAGSGGATFFVDDSTVKLECGSAALDGGASVTTGDGKIISNPGSDKKIVVTVIDGKDVVTIPQGGEAGIGTTKYTSAEDGTQIVAGGGNELIKGSVLLDSGEGITVDGVSVEGDESKPIVAGTTGDGKATVTVPEGGRAVIDGATIGGSYGAVIDIADGKTVVEIDAGKEVTINGSVCKGGDNGATRTIGSDGQVVKGAVEIETGAGASTEKEIDVGDTIKLPDQTKVEPPKPQQVLVGWKTTDENGEKEYGIGSDYTVEGDAKVEAVYADSSKVLVYTVGEEGGSVTGTTFEELDGSPVKLKEDGAQKEGYTFAGWKPKDGKDAVYAPGVSMDATQTTYMEAYFIPNSANTVTLTYEPENGSANVKKQTVEVGETVWLPTSLDVSRPGYTFKGWATESVTENEPATLGAEPSSTAGRTMIKTSYYTVKENETLYAVWESESSDHPGWWEDDDDPAWYDPTVVPSDDGSSDGKDGKRIALIIAAIAVAMTELAVLIAYRRK